MANEMLNISGRHTGNGIKYEADTEVFTGDYWIDGKPIYAYLFTKNIPALENNVAKNLISLADSKIDTLVSSDFCILRSDNVKINCNSDMCTTIGIANGNVVLYVNSSIGGGYYHNRTPEWVLIKYTKTTD